MCPRLRTILNDQRTTCHCHTLDRTGSIDYWYKRWLNRIDRSRDRPSSSPKKRQYTFSLSLIHINRLLFLCRRASVFGGQPHLTSESLFPLLLLWKPWIHNSIYNNHRKLISIYTSPLVYHPPVQSSPLVRERTQSQSLANQSFTDIPQYLDPLQTH